MLTEEKINILLDAAQEASDRTIAFSTLYHEFHDMGMEYFDESHEAWCIMMDSSSTRFWLMAAAEDLLRAEVGFEWTPMAQRVSARKLEILEKQCAANKSH